MKYLPLLLLLFIPLGFVAVFRPWKHQAHRQPGEYSILHEETWIEDGESFPCGTVFDSDPNLGELRDDIPTEAYSSHDIFTNKIFLTRHEAIAYVHKYCTDN